MTVGKLVVGRRVSVEECANALMRLVSKNSEEIARALHGANELFPNDSRLQNYEKKYKTFIEYFQSKKDDIAASLRELLRDNKKIKLYVFRMNLWAVYGDKTKNFIGEVLEEKDSCHINEELVGDIEIKADVGINVTKETSTAALLKMIGTSYEQTKTFAQSMNNQLNLFTKDEIEHLNERNNKFLNGIIPHVNEIADAVMETMKECNDITIKFSAFKVSLDLYKEDKPENKQIYPIAKKNAKENVEAENTSERNPARPCNDSVVQPVVITEAKPNNKNNEE